MEQLNLTKEILELWVNTIHISFIDDGWEIFKIYNSEYLYAVKLRRKYGDDDIKFNDDGYKYSTGEITLYKVSNGNMETQEISEKTFFN